MREEKKRERRAVEVASIGHLVKIAMRRKKMGRKKIKKGVIKVENHPSEVLVVGN